MRIDVSSTSAWNRSIVVSIIGVVRSSRSLRNAGRAAGRIRDDANALPGRELLAAGFLDDGESVAGVGAHGDLERRTVAQRLFGVAAQIMRRILVNHAEARNAAKRGGNVTRVTLDESVSWGGNSEVDVTALDEALTRLAQLDQRQARVVELRFFAGLSIDECAQVLDISPATVKREWTMAKTWLRDELAKD